MKLCQLDEIVRESFDSSNLSGTLFEIHSTVAPAVRTF
jgi:hypothetical protein